MDIIIIHGSPGTGKTTVATHLHERLKSPWFEFGWIPEFNQLNPHTRILPKKEEQLSFENLVLVCKNYLKYGFKNILLTDLQDIRMLDIATAFESYQYLIVTLYSNEDTLIKNRILNRNNGNEYRNVNEALNLNDKIKKRAPLANEMRLCIDGLSIEEMGDTICDWIQNYRQDSVVKTDVNKADYFTYFDKTGNYK